MIVIEEKPGIIGVFDSCELAARTGSGWVLIGVYQETVVGPGQHRCRTCQELSTATRTVAATHEPAQPTTVTRFLARLDSQSALAEVSKERDETRAELTVKIARVMELAGEVASLKKEIVEYSNEQKRLIAENQRDYARLLSAEEKARVYEIDIGGLRKAIGDLKFNEIVGAKT